MAEVYPKDQPEFERLFASEDRCVEYLVSLRWPEGFRCPKCQSEGYWLTKRGLLCCSACQHQASVTAGTLFHRSKKPLRLWFRAIWNITSQKYGANALGTKRVLGLGSYRTAWEWLHKLRRAMVRPGREKLSGVVEIDETYWGGSREGKRGRGAEGKKLIVVAVEDLNPLSKKGIGRIRLGHVPDASAKSLHGFISENVEQGSLIRTDGWKGYRGLESLGYQREIVVEDKKDLLPLCHLVISLLKRWLVGTYQGAVAGDHLDYYLDEFTFRFNRRKSRSRGKLFMRLIEQAAACGPVTRNEIRGGSKPSD